MDFYHKKYLKYKNKYINLKNIQKLKTLKGGKRDIFDFDEIFLNADNKYISKYLLDNKISSKCLDYIKSDLQILYKIYYEHLTNTSCEHILIPIYTNNKHSYQYRVNYVEQAKYYNIDEAELLGDIIVIDLKIDNALKIISDKLLELQVLGVFTYTHIDKLILFINNLKTPNDKLLFIEIVDKLINLITIDKINLDNYIIENSKFTDNTFNIDKYMTIIKKIINNGSYEIDDNYRLVFRPSLNKSEFMNDLDLLELVIIFDKEISSRTDIEILIEIYKKLRTIIISNSTIEKIKYFLYLLQKVKFNIIDKNNNVINFELISSEKIKDVYHTYFEVKNNFMKLYELVKKLKDNVTQILKDITEQNKILNKYHYLFILKNKYVNFLDMNDIVNINEQQILTNVNNNKNTYIEKIIGEFLKDETKNDKIIQITLQYITELKPGDKEYNDYNKYNIELHANIIILSKFKYKNKTCILGRRIEPHRHSNTYCRNSIRKEIRDIFERLPNFFYVDYYMKNHMGLQCNECIDIKKDYIRQYFDVINENISCKVSQLYKIDGFCATWCAYITSILLLNKQISIDDLSKYFTNFDVQDDKSFTDEYIEEYEKIKKDDKTAIDLFITNFTKFFKPEIFKYTSSGFRYNYIKNLKLYTFIIYYCKFICNKYNIIRFTFPEQDYNYLKEIYEFYKTKNYEKDVKEIIKKSYIIQIIPNDKILDIYKVHLCEDKLFNHNEMCLEQEICKDVPIELKDICDNEDKICLKFPDKIKLNEIERENILKFNEFEKKLTNMH